ncbi:unnamed protein product [Leptidea sinapis]|uniref:PHD-type domain-containing protein n=1 Tax=Leptidea sinapis TaxID=189913 RepID=A0A5E4QCQ3_9NEOP|nr:unnamed protein product [Leptidea sinapis]
MVGECLACNIGVLETQKRIRCTKCNGLYHTECISSNSEQIGRINWVCPACAAGTRKGGDNTNTCIRVPLRIETSPSTSSIINNQTDCSTILSELKSFRSEMHSRLNSQKEKFDAFSNGLNCLQTELADMRKSFQSLQNDLDSVIECSNNIKESNNRNTEVLNDTVNSIGVIQSQIKEHNDSLDFISKKIEALQVESSSHSYIISDLKNDSSTFDHNFKSLLSKVMQLERISRSHNIEIQAVPERKNENLNTIIKKIFDKISVSLPDDVVISCNRVAKRTVSDRPRTIVVTLMTLKHRDLILSAVHRYNKANPKDMLCSLVL